MNKGDFTYWQTPCLTLEGGRIKARDAANARQQAVTLYRVKDRYTVRLAYDFAPKGEDVEKLETVHPSIAEAPYIKWEVVDVGAFSERVIRDARVDAWRLTNRRSTPPGPHPKPFGIQVGEKKIRLHGNAATIYTYIVRRNPRFQPPIPGAVS